MKYSLKAIMAALKLINETKPDMEFKAPAPFFSDAEREAMRLVNELAADALPKAGQGGPVDEFYARAYGHDAVMQALYIGVAEGADQPCGAICSSHTDDDFATAELELEKVIRSAAQHALGQAHAIINAVQTIKGEDWFDYQGILGVATVYECHGDMRRIKQWGFRLSLTKEEGCAICAAPHPKKVSYDTFDPSLMFPFLGAIYDAGGDLLSLPPEDRREGLERAVRAATGHLN